MKAPKSVNCPNCHSEVIWSKENEYRPFCSERCKLIDFGGWASEKHAIPGESVLISEPDFNNPDLED
ncbi:MAG: DNA gyrase inhibitor YacG [Gammaproteobacteria bacterium]|nr:DNA gyrase inhibitor YacG [Gammaproteobacteria bacterium]